jgi:hypothetical protein
MIKVTIGVHRERRMKPINTLCNEERGFQVLQQVVDSITTWL